MEKNLSLWSLSWKNTEKIHETMGEKEIISQDLRNLIFPHPAKRPKKQKVKTNAPDYSSEWKNERIRGGGERGGKNSTRRLALSHRRRRQWKNFEQRVWGESEREREKKVFPGLWIFKACTEEKRCGLKGRRRLLRLLPPWTFLVYSGCRESYEEKGGWRGGGGYGKEVNFKDARANLFLIELAGMDDYDKGLRSFWGMRFFFYSSSIEWMIFFALLFIVTCEWAMVRFVLYTNEIRNWKKYIYHKFHLV